ncbi:MAG: hypothetical protein COX96_01845, partial [Candidatus Omnitrophica bacterium CG_4_10_14_0_2_um_filter_44_9]
MFLTGGCRMKVARRALGSCIILFVALAFASSIFAQAETEVETLEGVQQETAPGEAVIQAGSPEQVAPTEPEARVMPTGSAASVAPEPAVPTEAKPTEWVWGEVVSVDAANKQIVIKHLDYDTYEEVQTILKVGDKTLFENVAALGDIKAGNHLTADFKIVEGSNVADLIVVEKDAQR